VTLRLGVMPMQFREDITLYRRKNDAFTLRKAGAAHVSEWDGPAVLPPNQRACLWGSQEKEPRHATQL
jgi:hypothetical protein